MIVTPVLTLTVLVLGFVAFLVTGSMGRGSF
jgi:hypothetical protein